MSYAISTYVYYVWSTFKIMSDQLSNYVLCFTLSYSDLFLTILYVLVCHIIALFLSMSYMLVFLLGLMSY